MDNEYIVLEVLTRNYHSYLSRDIITKMNKRFDLMKSKDQEKSLPDNWLTRLWDRILQFGLRESALRFSTVALSTLLLLVVALFMNRFYATESGGVAANSAQNDAASQSLALEATPPTFSLEEQLSGSGGLYKEVTLH